MPSLSVEKLFRPTKPIQAVIPFLPLGFARLS
jgi:hypothetical protein